MCCKNAAKMCCFACCCDDNAKAVSFAFAENSLAAAGVLCADIILISYSTPKLSSFLAAFSITPRSESLPITIATFFIIGYLSFKRNLSLFIFNNLNKKTQKHLVKGRLCVDSKPNPTQPILSFSKTEPAMQEILQSIVGIFTVIR